MLTNYFISRVFVVRHLSKRQLFCQIFNWLLEESIGTMTIENEAFKTIWITFSVALISFLVGPILSLSLFKWINSSFHPCHDIIAEEIKKEKANQDKEPCWGIFSFCSNFHPMQQF